MATLKSTSESKIAASMSALNLLRNQTWPNKRFLLLNQRYIAKSKTSLLFPLESKMAVSRTHFNFTPESKWAESMTALNFASESKWLFRDRS